MQQDALRAALVARFDQTITPDVAAAIERDAMALPDESHDPAKFGKQAFGDYTIQAERLRDVIDELSPLHEAHWSETERARIGLTMNPDYEAMLRDEKAGRLLQFTARKDGLIAAHLRLYLCRSRHTQTLFSEEDALYVKPEHRGGFLVMRLLHFAERALLSLGISEIRANSKLVNRADVLMKRMKYTPVALQFVKFISES